MSFRAYRWAIEQRIVDPLAKFVLVALGDAHNGTTGKCFPKISQIEFCTGLSERTIQRKIRDLAEAGLLTVRAMSKPDSGRQLANEYVLHLDQVEQVNVEDQEAETECDGRQTDTPMGGSQTPIGDIWAADGHPTGGAQTPLIRNQEENQEDSLVPSGTCEPAPRDRFEEFWAAYPDRRGSDPKKAARQVFERIVRGGADPDRIIAKAKAYAGEHPNATQYVAMARTWLNQEDFEDHASAAPPVDREQWQRRLRCLRRDGFWDEAEFGPPPGQAGCRVPPELLEPPQAGAGRSSRAKEAAA